MEPNPPLTAKQAALLGAKGDKPPFNPEADRRHVIASIIRRAGEATGHSEQSAAAADSNQAAPLEIFDAANESQSQTAADWAAPVDSAAMGDMSLAQIIAADQAAERGFAVRLRTPDDEGDIGIPRFDGTPSPQSFRDLLGSTGRDLSDYATPDVGQSTDLTNCLPGMRDISPINSYSELESGPEQRSVPSLPACHAENLLYRLDEPRRVEHPIRRLDEKSHYSRSDLFASDGLTADQRPTFEDTPSITVLPLGESGPATDVAGETSRWQVELGVANVEKNSAIAYRAIEAILLEAIDRAGEQDRIDALHRAASHRACL